MLKKLISATLTALLAVSVMATAGAGTAAAATTTGSGPDQAIAPTGQWTAAAPGATTWYEFQYAGDTSQIEAWMDVVGNNTTFSVVTPEEVAAWAAGSALDPVGRGSADGYAAGDLSWSGNFNEAGVYYLVVENAGPDTSYYLLDIAGSGVYLPAEAAAEQTTTAAAETTAVAETAAAPTSGATPEDAFTIPAYDVAIAPAGSIWHSFQYAGDESQILAWLDAQGQSGLSFSVWTPDQVKQIENGQSVEPVGRGSVNEYGPGDLSWLGAFPQAGTYFLKVDNSGSAVINYTVQINGSGVW
jgi:hypothetical protein